MGYFKFFFTALYQLGVVPGKRSFFHKNQRNDQEQSLRSEKKNDRIERVLKNIWMICKEEQNENRTIEKKEQERNNLAEG